MDWLHCNHCFALGSDSSENVQFFIANCGQVVCSRCTDGSTQKCLFHDHDCCYTPLTALKKEHEALFSNVLQILQKNLKYLDFQMNQYGSLLNYLKSKLARYNVHKQEISTLKSECRRHRDEKNSLKNELIQKHDEIQELKMQIERYQRQSQYHGGQSSYFSEKGSDPSGRQNYLFGSINNQQLSFSPLANQSSSSSVFTPPLPVTQPKTYRESNVFNLCTPQQRKVPFQSPPTSEYSSTLHRANSRSVLLPGDKGSSPLGRISLQRLNLKTAPSSYDRMSQPGAQKTARRAPKIGIYGLSWPHLRHIGGCVTCWCFGSVHGGYLMEKLLLYAVFLPLVWPSHENNVEYFHFPEPTTFPTISHLERIHHWKDNAAIRRAVQPTTGKRPTTEKDRLLLDTYKFLLQAITPLKYLAERNPYTLEPGETRATLGRVFEFISRAAGQAVAALKSPASRRVSPPNSVAASACSRRSNFGNALKNVFDNANFHVGYYPKRKKARKHGSLFLNAGRGKVGKGRHAWNDENVGFGVGLGPVKIGTAIGVPPSQRSKLSRMRRNRLRNRTRNKRKRGMNRRRRRRNKRKRKGRGRNNRKRKRRGKKTKRRKRGRKSRKRKKGKRRKKRSLAISEEDYDDEVQTTTMKPKRRCWKEVVTRGEKKITIRRCRNTKTYKIRRNKKRRSGRMKNGKKKGRRGKGRQKGKVRRRPGQIQRKSKKKAVKGGRRPRRLRSKMKKVKGKRHPTRRPGKSKKKKGRRRPRRPGRLFKNSKKGRRPRIPRQNKKTVKGRRPGRDKLVIGRPRRPRGNKMKKVPINARRPRKGRRPRRYRNKKEPARSRTKKERRPARPRTKKERRPARSRNKKGWKPAIPRTKKGRNPARSRTKKGGKPARSRSKKGRKQARPRTKKGRKGMPRKKKGRVKKSRGRSKAATKCVRKVRINGKWQRRPCQKGRQGRPKGRVVRTKQTRVKKIRKKRWKKSRRRCWKRYRKNGENKWRTRKCDPGRSKNQRRSLAETSAISPEVRAKQSLAQSVQSPFLRVITSLNSIARYLSPKMSQRKAAVDLKKIIIAEFAAIHEVADQARRRLLGSNKRTFNTKAFRTMARTCNMEYPANVSPGFGQLETART